MSQQPQEVKGKAISQHPLISIVTITYNAAAQLPATMESVATQTYDDFEHIIIDGASADDTLGIARRLGKPALRILSEPDKGLYDAMNKGIKLARGKYIIFLNAGDAFHSKDTLKKYGDAACKDPDIIYADTVIVDNERNAVGPRHLSVPEVLTFESFAKGMLICHQAFMVKKALAPLYDTSYRFSADYDWTVKCIKNTTPARCINLHTVAIDYLSDGLTDKNKLKSLWERYAIMSDHYGHITTAINHLSFIGRAVKRRIKGH